MVQKSRSEQDNRAYVYTLDKHDQLVSVNANWLDFAQENGAPELKEDTVLGRTLWDFFADRHTILIHQLIVEKVRSNNRPITFSCRGDSSDWFRLVDSVVSPLDDGGVEYSNTLIAQYPRSPVSVLVQGIERSERFVTMCSWCKGIIQRNSVISLEYINELMGESMVKTVPEIRYGTCDDCYNHQHRAIAAQI